MSQRQIGGSDLPPHPHERWHGNMSTGLISENSLAFCLPRPNSGKKNLSTPTMHFLSSSSAGRPIGAGMSQQPGSTVPSKWTLHSTLNLRMMF